MVAARRFRFVIGGLAVGLAALSVPVAAADPGTPSDPAAAAPATVVPAADPGPAPVVDAALSPAAAPAADPATPPDGVQHLPSPDSLPPGTTQAAPDHPTAGLLREVWHALRDGEMTGPDALKLLATRPVDPAKLAGSTPSNQGGTAAPDPAPAPVPVAAPAPAS